MRKNLAIYGGFYGDETILDERHGNETIFSGDNKRRIFYNQSLDSTAILDTATITRGYADMGAGIYNDDKSAPVFKKCYFTANIATTNGGAIFNNHSNANFYDCRFESNRAANNGGGGVFNNYYSQAYYKKCIFKNNTAYKGAGAYDSHISPTTYDECLFESNSTTTDIGGGYFSTGGCITNISNSLFLSNKSTRGGAAYMASGETTFTNCTFYKNHAEGAPATIINNGKIRVINCTFAANDGDWGGTVYAQTNSTAKIVNSIFKNNTGTYLKQISSDDSSTFIASNCSIEGGLDGENIQSANPFLKDLKNNGGFTKTIALRSDSPARASGKTGIALDDCIIPISDARGKSRASPCTLGAYEIISAQSYDIWAQENLEAAQDKSACASPYPDNITNLQRYAQALSAEPIELSSTPLSSAVSAPCAIKNNKFEFRQAKDTTGFSVDVYYTSDLKNWQKTKATVIDSSFPDAQIMRAVAPEFSDNKNIFYKLIITKKDLTESNQ